MKAILAVFELNKIVLDTGKNYCIIRAIADGLQQTKFRFKGHDHEVSSFICEPYSSRAKILLLQNSSRPIKSLGVQ